MFGQSDAEQKSFGILQHKHLSILVQHIASLSWSANGATQCTVKLSNFKPQECQRLYIYIPILVALPKLLTSERESKHPNLLSTQGTLGSAPYLCPSTPLLSPNCQVKSPIPRRERGLARKALMHNVDHVCGYHFLHLICTAAQNGRKTKDKRDKVIDIR